MGPAAEQDHDRASEALAEQVHDRASEAQGPASVVGLRSADPDPEYDRVLAAPARACVRVALVDRLRDPGGPARVGPARCLASAIASPTQVTGSPTAPPMWPIGAVTCRTA